MRNAVETQSETWVTRLAFRDHLIQNPEVARAYANLKGQLAQEYAWASTHIRKGEGFIRQVLQAARSDASA